MAKIINPPQKKTYTSVKKKRQPFDFKKHKKLLIILSSALLAAIILSTGLGIFLNWYFVDTKYDSISFKSNVVIPEFSTLKPSEESVTKSFEYYKKMFLRSNSSFTPVTEGNIVEGYNVTVDAIGYFINDGVVDTTPYSPSKLDDYEITDIGNHVTENGASFFPEVQNALIGKSVAEGTKASTDLKYADDYSIESLKGKTMRFEITVVSVTKTNFPEYNNAFVKLKTGFDSVEAYEKALRDMVERELVWTSYISKTEIKKYPEKFVKLYSEELDDQYQEKMASEKLTFQNLLSSLGLKNEEEYNKMLVSEAQRVIKEEMALYRIAKLEKIRISNKEYKAELKRFADQSDLTEYEFEKAYGKEYVTYSLTLDRAKEQLRKIVTE